ncbi:MAG: DUF3786 domain-containing protein [Oscillospiraceae bacterium]|nr:DUF3786 domain-containing protein [Oscillospiraceae bacterium]
MSSSNYEITLLEARKLFLCYEQSRMIEKFSLEHDAQYLYIQFIGQRHRIDRATGVVEWLDWTGKPHEADFNASLSIYDVLCSSKPNCSLSGQFGSINSVASGYHTQNLGGSIFDACAPVFSEHPDLLEKALILLGGVKDGKGDIAYRINLFPFLPVQVQFWEADEDFPASLQIHWDLNTLQFLRYETTYYAAGHLLHRLRELMETV